MAENHWMATGLVKYQALIVLNITIGMVMSTGWYCDMIEKPERVAQLMDRLVYAVGKGTSTIFNLKITNENKTFSNLNGVISFIIDFAYWMSGRSNIKLSANTFYPRQGRNYRNGTLRRAHFKFNKSYALDLPLCHFCCLFKWSTLLTLF